MFVATEIKHTDFAMEPSAEREAALKISETSRNQRRRERNRTHRFRDGTEGYAALKISETSRNRYVRFQLRRTRFRDGTIR